jgi:DNA-directed RNA polymerase specialized sigma24 family protein
VHPDVVAQAGAGDERAWRQLVERHLGLVHAICRAYGLDGPAAAEVNQLVWLRLVEHLTRIRTPDAIGGWIAATTRALCLAPERSPARSGYTAGALVAHPNGNGSSWMAAAFARMGARCQRLLRLAATRPRPPDEDISAALDLAAAQVEPTCIRCLERFQRLLATPSPAPFEDLARILAEGGAPPEGWCEVAAAAHAWLVLDAAPAELVYDSTTVVGRDVAGHARGRGTRAAAGAQVVRRLRFAAPHDGVELVVDAKSDEVLLVGRLTSGCGAPVTVRWPAGERCTRTDESGSFRFHGLPFAPVCLEVGGDRPLKTGWILP